eukprot:Rhum_TRINITY_DN15423_c5_g12::Rhum_TRINITY_DN15423_c5_g12_i1::g.156039::m.156039
MAQVAFCGGLRVRCPPVTEGGCCLPSAVVSTLPPAQALVTSPPLQFRKNHYRAVLSTPHRCTDRPCLITTQPAMEAVIRDDVSGKEATHEVSETATAGGLLEEACTLF